MQNPDIQPNILSDSKYQSSALKSSAIYCLKYPQLSDKLRHQPMILILKRISWAMWELQTVNSNSEWEIGRKHYKKDLADTGID